MTRRTIFVVYCDDIRQEIGNKQSWMGIYTKELIVPLLPALLPKISIAARLEAPRSQPFLRVRLFAKLDDTIVFEHTFDEDELRNIAQELNPTSEHNNAKATLALSIAIGVGPIPIERDCLLQLFAETEVDGELLKGHKLEMRTATEKERASMGALWTAGKK